MNAATVQTAFQGMSTVDATSTVAFSTDKTAACDATGSNTMTFTFAGAAAPQVALTSMGTGGPTLAHVVTTAGTAAVVAVAAVQAAVCTGNAGTFTLTHGSQTTPAIPFGATQDQVQREFRLLTTVDGASTVAFTTGKTDACDATGSNTMTFTFGGAAAPQAILTSTGTGGPTLAHVVTTAGTAAVGTPQAILTSVGTGGPTLAHAVTAVGTTKASAGAEACTTCKASNTVQECVDGTYVSPACKALRAGAAAVQAVQTVTCTGTGGSFKLTHGGAHSADIPFDATDADVQTAFRGISTVDDTSTVAFTTGKATACDAGGTNAMTFTFGGTAAPQATLTKDTTSLTPVTVVAVPAVQTVKCTGTAGSFKLTHGGVDSAGIPFNADAAAVTTAFAGMTGNAGGTVTFSGAAACEANPGNTMTLTFGGTAAPQVALTSAVVSAGPVLTLHTVTTAGTAAIAAASVVVASTVPGVTKVSAVTSGRCGIISMMDPGYDPGVVQQMVKNLNLAYELPFLGYGGSQSHVSERTVADKPVLFYHWIPDIYHVSNPDKFMRIMLPESSKKCDDTGNGDPSGGINCDFVVQPLTKFHPKDLETTAGSAATKFLKAFAMSQTRLDELLSELIAVLATPSAYDGRDHFQAACSWIKKNPDAWKDWIEPWPPTCPAGKYCPLDLTYLQLCYPCPTGTYMVGSNTRSSCDPCPMTEWTDKEGSTTCKACPENTKALFMGSTSVRGCVCKEGYFHPQGEPGLACIKCPFGGKCLGGAARPYPEPGYWAVAESNRTEVWECAARAACPGWMKGKAEVDSFVCGEGYTGRMCNSCEDGFFKFSGFCYNCVGTFGSAYKFAYAVLLLATIAAWIALNKFVSMIDAVDVSLLFLQILFIVGTFNLNWDETAQSVLSGLTFTNFNVDFVSPQCVTPYTIADAFVLNMMMPFFAVGLLALDWGYTLLKSKGKKGDTSEHHWRAVKKAGGRRRSSANGRLSVTGAPVAVPLGTMVGSEITWKEQTLWETWFENSIFTFGSFLNIVYPSLVYQSFSVFRCMDMAGTSVMVADPTLECGSSAHQGLQAGAVLGIIFYVIGIPAMFSYVLWNGERHTLFDNQDYRDRFGWLFERYESEFYFWELTFVFRRLAFVSISVFVDDGIVQGVTGLFTIGICTMMHFYARAFADVSLDYLDSTALALLFVLIGCGMFFNERKLDAEMGNELAGYVDAFKAIVFLLFAVGFWQVVSSSYNNLRAKRCEQQIHKSVNKNCGESAWEPCLGLCEVFDSTFLAHWMKLTAAQHYDGNKETGGDKAFADFENVAQSMLEVSRVGAGLSDQEVEEYKQRTLFYRHLSKGVPEIIDYLMRAEPAERLECTSLLKSVADFVVKAKISEEFGGDPHECFSTLFKEESFQNVVQWITMRSDDEEQIIKFKRITDGIVLSKAAIAATAGARWRNKAGTAKVAADMESGNADSVTVLAAATTAPTATPIQVAAPTAGQTPIQVAAPIVAAGQTASTL